MTNFSKKNPKQTEKKLFSGSNCALADSWNYHFLCSEAAVTFLISTTIPSTYSTVQCFSDSDGEKDYRNNKNLCTSAPQCRGHVHGKMLFSDITLGQFGHFKHAVHFITDVNPRLTQSVLARDNIVCTWPCIRRRRARGVRTPELSPVLVPRTG